MHTTQVLRRTCFFRHPVSSSCNTDGTMPYSYERTLLAAYLVPHPSQVPSCLLPLSISNSRHPTPHMDSLQLQRLGHKAVGRPSLPCMKPFLPESTTIAQVLR